MKSVVKTGGFCIRFLAKEVRKSGKWKDEKLKACVFEGPSDLKQYLSKNYLCFSSNILAEIMHFN